MDYEENTAANQRQIILQELRQFGFDPALIQIALTYTTNKEIAAEIILKLIQEGINTDLSLYKQSIHFQNKTQIQQPKPLEDKKPIRPKMIFVVNGSLKMGKGKICAQVAHAVIGAYMQIEEQAKFDQHCANRLKAWQSSGSPKIVVKAPTEQQMLQIENKIKSMKIGLNTYIVEDAGHTQIKEGSKTILAIGPAFSNEIDPFTEHLKLV